MFFRKRKKDIEKHAKKFDKLVTGLIIWGAVASMVGLSKTNKWKQVAQNIKKEWAPIFKRGVSLFGKWLVGIIRFFNKKK